MELRQIRCLRIAAALASLVLLCAVGGLTPDTALAQSKKKGDAKARLLLDVETPRPDAVVGDTGGMAFLSGRALAMFGELQTFDIMFVVDTSESTSTPSGYDVDGDGRVEGAGRPRWLRTMGAMLPLPSRTSGDSVLAAEVAAVRGILEQLDPRSTRVGVVSFSGDHDPLTPDAWTVVPLTSDFGHVNDGLDELLDMGPAGMTNMVKGVDQAMIELYGFSGAYSDKREGARRVIVFLTDGIPTLPLTGRRDNSRMAISRAMKAARLKIRIDTYAIGEEALHEPVVAVEMARVTSGIFTPVREPKNLRALFEELNFAEIESLEIKNLTNGAAAAYKIQNADGSFSALLPMKEGRNDIEVTARSTDGTTATKTIPVRFLEGAKSSPLPPRLIAQRNRLLENRLADLRRRSLEIEIERDEQVRRDLMVEIEEEREKARQRAEDAKRRLKIETEE